MNSGFVCENIKSKNGHLYFAEQDTLSLAGEYGTPVYLMDEDRIREKCRIYLETFREAFPKGSKPLYASKACSFRQMYRIMQELDMGIDVVSTGEIHTAYTAGYDMKNAFFHSSCKSASDVCYAMDRGVGYFVADNGTELELIEAEAAKRGIVQNILLRLTPGIDTHTYEAVNTGKVDSKFGIAIETGQAQETVGAVLKMKHIRLDGFHCHVGSQVFEEDVFERSAVIMLRFCAEMKKKYGYITQKLDLGGGYGVPYVESDGRIDIASKIRSVSACMKAECESLEIDMPQVLMEPGRSIVADAGITLYTCGNVKKIPGYKNYAAVDGGMTDNPRYALYGSKYSVYAAGRMDEARDMTATVVGRCCESGDIIQPDVQLPSGLKAGDIIAVCTTGAYNYSMASNYNRIGRPPVVMLKKGTHYTAVKRESPEDLCSNDL